VTPEVFHWRLALLLEAGFEDGLAHALAGHADIDLHGLLTLVDRGCPPPLAARILAPLDGGLDYEPAG
jgi:hypothetical protein